MKNNSRTTSRFPLQRQRVAAAIALAFGAVGAQAAPFTLSFADATTDPTTVYYSLASTTNPSYSLSAQIVFDLISITSDQAEFAVTVTNTTPVATKGENRLVSFGIDSVTPNLTGSKLNNNDATATNWTSLLDENFPGFNRLELCAIGKSNANNCAGGGNDGLAEGQSDSFTWILYGMFGLTSPAMISFTSPIPIRFQSIDSKLWGDNSITFDALPPAPPPAPPPPAPPPPAPPPPVFPPAPPGPPAPPAEEPPQQVPEPGSLMLVGLGLLGAAVARRRERRRP